MCGALGSSRIHTTGHTCAHLPPFGMQFPPGCTAPPSLQERWKGGCRWLPPAPCGAVRSGQGLPGLFPQTPKYQSTFPSLSAPPLHGDGFCCYFLIRQAAQTPPSPPHPDSPPTNNPTDICGAPVGCQLPALAVSPTRNAFFPSPRATPHVPSVLHAKAGRPLGFLTPSRPAPPCLPLALRPRRAALCLNYAAADLFSSPQV